MHHVVFPQRAGDALRRALDATLPADSSATPVSAGGGPSSLRLSGPVIPPQRWQNALFWSLGIAGGLLASGAALAALLGGR